MARSVVPILAALLALILSCGKYELPTQPQSGLNAGASAGPGSNSRRRSVIRIGELTPACASPAPLAKSFCGGAGYIVSFRQGTPEGTTATLAAKYDFRLQYDFGSSGFSAYLSANQVAALRCEPSVLRIEEQGRLQPDLGQPPAPCP